MKITATYKTFQQVSPDDFKTFTRVIHLEKNDTLSQAFAKITEGWINKTQVNVELHFTDTDK